MTKSITIKRIEASVLFIAAILGVYAVYMLASANIAHAQETTNRPIKTLEARIEQNREVRNALLDKRQEVKKEMKAELKDVRAEKKEEMKLLRASTTTEFKKNNEIRKDIKQKMEAKQFEIRKNALLKELGISLANLANISTRIEARIVKAEESGRTMTEARALFVEATAKLTKAKADVAAFQALNIGPVSANATTTAEVDLVKPRVAGDAAIKSVKEARDAFQKVVVAIAHSMGNPTKATSTPSTN